MSDETKYEGHPKHPNVRMRPVPPEEAKKLLADYEAKKARKKLLDEASAGLGGK